MPKIDGLGSRPLNHFTQHHLLYMCLYPTTTKPLHQFTQQHLTKQLIIVMYNFIALTQHRRKVLYIIASSGCEIFWQILCVYRLFLPHKGKHVRELIHNTVTTFCCKRQQQCKHHFFLTMVFNYLPSFQKLKPETSTTFCCKRQQYKHHFFLTMVCKYNQLN